MNLLKKCTRRKPTLYLFEDVHNRPGVQGTNVLDVLTLMQQGLNILYLENFLYPHVLPDCAAAKMVLSRDYEEVPDEQVGRWWKGAQTRSVSNPQGYMQTAWYLASRIPRSELLLIGAEDKSARENVDRYFEGDLTLTRDEFKRVIYEEVPRRDKAMAKNILHDQHLRKWKIAGLICGRGHYRYDPDFEKNFKGKLALCRVSNSALQQPSFAIDLLEKELRFS